MVSDDEGRANVWRGLFAHGRLPISIDLGRVAAALLLSGLLYVYAANESNSQTAWLTPFTVPVDVVNVPAGLVSTQDVAPVQLRVLATVQALTRLRASSFTAQVDASPAHAGDTDLPIDVRSTDSGVTQVAAVPPQVTVHLEPVDQRVVPVQVDLSGQVPDGYQLGQPVANPTRVTVTGPASVVDQAAEDVVDVSVEGITVSVNGVFNARVVDAAGNSLPSVSAHSTPASVSVQVPITELAQYKEVGVQPVTQGNPAPGYVVQPLQVNPATVTLVGDATTLASVRWVPTQPVNISGITSTGVRTVPLVPPAGTLLLQPAETVTVTVRVSPLVTSQTLRVPPAAINLAPGVALAQLPGVVSVKITGPSPTLSKLAGADLQVVLDMAGRGPGEYQIAPQVQNLPSGMTVDNIDPQQVSVELRAVNSAQRFVGCTPGAFSAPASQHTQHTRHGGAAHLFAVGNTPPIEPLAVVYRVTLVHSLQSTAGALCAYSTG